MAQSKHACTPPIPVHRCTDHGCIYLGRPSGESCACHKTREQMLVEQRAELLTACKAAEEWLSGWATAEPYLTTIRTAIAKAEGGAS